VRRAAVLATVLLAGCGGRIVAHESIEKLVESKLPHAGKVSCPDVDDHAGARFTCTAGGRTLHLRLARHEQVRLLGGT
jgi:hypothetical protein